jgi:hypothetical protein
MAKGAITVPREPIAQPEVGSTRKGQKRYRAGAEYDPLPLNAELDYVHERINQVVVESAALEDLESSATLAETITRVNELAEILRSAGLLKSS